MSGPQILVADGDAARREALAGYLRRGDFAVSEAADAAGLHWTLGQEGADLVLLDLMLPGEGALALCRRLADARGPAVIMLSEGGEAFGQGGEADRIAALELGADDYLERPFSPRELTARIRAVLRRAGKFGKGGKIELGGIVLDVEQHRVNVGPAELSVSPTEYRLLEFFLTHPGKVYSRTQLLDQVWGRSTYIEERTVDVHIRRLRKILAEHRREELIQTVRGFGYRFSETA